MTEETTATRASARYLAKKDRILLAATSVLNTQGVSGFTLIAVAEVMGVHPASLAYYYKKKDELIAACLTETIGRFGAMLDLAEAEAGPRARVAAFIGAYFETRKLIFAGEAAELASFNEVRFLGEPFGREVMRAFWEMFPRIGRLFSDNPGGVDATRAGLRARFVLEQLMWAVAWLRPKAPEDFDRAARRMTDILLDGLAHPAAGWPQMTHLELAPPAAAERGAPREAFLRAASQLINEQGYRGASVDKISARLNLTKGAFYYHNTDKDDLVVACFERTFQLMRDAQRRAALAPTGWERVCLAASALAVFHNSPTGPLVRAYALSALPPALRQKMLENFMDMAHRFADFVSEGVEDGSIRNVDPQVAGQMIMALINSSAYLGAWAPGITRDQVVQGYVRPGLMGLLRGADIRAAD